jgi:GMC oxidoreductase/FAD binding domain
MIDDARTVPPGTTLETELCIVGAGAAGIALALACAESGLNVLLLESGGFEEEPETQALQAGMVADPALHSPPHTYRARRLGGSTTLWGGRCAPFDPIDFERRPWMAESGWPIGYADLLPYYPAANALCEAGDFAYTAQAAFPAGMRPLIPGFMSDDFTSDALERFSCPTDFGRRYHTRLAASRTIRVLLHANAVVAETTSDGATVRSLTVRALERPSFQVRARLFVLAMGGLEIPRLLLACRDTHARGIGNAHGLLGRYYMCHIAGTLGALRLNAPATLWHGYQLSDDGIYCRRRLALTEAAQRRLSIGNCIIRLHHPRIPDPSHRTGALSAIYLARHWISYEYGKRLTGGEPETSALQLRHALNLLTDAGGVAGFALHWLRRRRLAERKFPSVIIRPRSGVFSLDIHAEQEPNPLSRITLTRETDRLGLPRLCVDWRHTAGDLRTVAATVEAFAGAIATGGHGRLEYDPEEIAVAMLRDGAYGGHHLGTARMAVSPRHGVVDAACRVHGMHNLYLAGGAVFATSSQANPTLTIVALALRLADRLTQELRGGLQAEAVSLRTI